MKQEFITVRGKVIVENGAIRIKNFKQRKRSDFYFYAFWLLLLYITINKNLKALPLANFWMGMVALFLLFWLIDAIFLNSWKNRILLSSVKSYRVTNDDFGLETCVAIYLKSGKRKEILFRTNEKQFDPFLELLSQQITQPLTA